MYYVVISTGIRVKFNNLFSALEALDQISMAGNYAACLCDAHGVIDAVGCGKVGE